MRLADATSMGAVDLLVRDLDVMTAYYAEGIGLDVLENRGDTVVLGRSGQVVMRLKHTPGLPGFHRGDAGLFHTAILFDTPGDLAASVFSTARHAPRSFTGTADHLVSEAFYFDDPEGNGVELYTDRPRDQWVSAGGGQIKMASLPLDPNDYLQTHLPRSVVEGGVQHGRIDGAHVGHVHLQVGNIPEGEAFYSGVLGFDVTARMGNQALFISAGGYHHHVGLNTWNSAGAGPRAASLGLESLSIEVPTPGDLDALAHRLEGAGLEFERRSDAAHAGASLLTDDPWGTTIEISATRG